ncbi:MAG: hypothetical protein H7249_07965 [Chitinophagaceae bacterium]|nr:hypothetical protein [Oligoflexus sp.]
MKRLVKSLIVSLFLLSAPAHAEDSAKEKSSGEDPGETESVVPPVVDTKVPTKNEYETLLNTWVKNSDDSVHAIPRNWLFLQEQSGAYGAPSPLGLDATMFDAYGWFHLADSDAIRLFIQLNPTQKKDELKPEMMAARLKRYADLTQADAIVLKTSATPSKWAVYVVNKGLDAPQLSFDKGPDALRLDFPAKWLSQQLAYDAVVVGNEGDYLVLAKLRPLKRGAQGLVLRKSAGSLVGDAEKDVGALLRVLHETDDYVLAKVSLTKSERSKVSVGSKVLFDQP